MGLVNVEALHYYPIRSNADFRFAFQIPLAAISALKPKYLVAAITHCQIFLLNDPDFLSHYTELKRWTNPDMKDQVVCIWMRKEDQAEEHKQEINESTKN